MAWWRKRPPPAWGTAAWSPWYAATLRRSDVRDAQDATLTLDRGFVVLTPAPPPAGLEAAPLLAEGLGRRP